MNALQTLSFSTSRNQTKLDPLSDSTLLAELLVPHLEAYLAVNTTVRILILLYPADHLSTVISLRTLLGNKLLKIAGVLDSHAYGHPSRTRPSTPTSSRRLPNEAHGSPGPLLNFQNRSRTNSIFATAHPTPSQTTIRPSPAILFSKANYLLPSIATDSEIAIFLSGIWASLVEETASYNPRRN